MPRKSALVFPFPDLKAGVIPLIVKKLKNPTSSELFSSEEAPDSHIYRALVPKQPHSHLQGPWMAVNPGLAVFYAPKPA